MKNLENEMKYKYFMNNYWDYFLELEKEFIETRKYVEFSKENFKTYSIEYLKLIQAICSEIDVVGKMMALEINSNFKENNSSIIKWWFEIQNEFKIKKTPENNNDISTPKDCNCALSEFTCEFTDSVSLKPWDSFIVERKINGKNRTIYTSNGTTPKWWKDYNAIKHSRTFPISGKETKTRTNFTKANLKNLCNSLAALYALESTYIEYVKPKHHSMHFDKVSKLFQKISFTI